MLDNAAYRRVMVSRIKGRPYGRPLFCAKACTQCDLYVP